MKTMKKLLAVFLALLMIFGTGINQGMSSAASINNQSAAINSASFAVSENALITKPSGHLYLMTGIPSETIIWESSDTSVATVDSSGIVTGVAVGYATITAKNSSEFYYLTCQVVVMEEFMIENITSIEVSPSSTVIWPDKTLQLFADVFWIGQSNDYTESTAETCVIWSTNNPSIAVVNSKGLVTSKSEGIAIITATSIDGLLSASATVSVKEPVGPIPKPEEDDSILVKIIYYIYYYICFGWLFNILLSDPEDPEDPDDPEPSDNDGQGVVNGYVARTQAIRKNDQLTFDYGDATAEKEKFVLLALSQVGYHEGKRCGTGKDKDGNDAPGKPDRIYFPTSDNWTKYGYLLDGSYLGAWCAAFVSACATEAEISTDKVTRGASAAINMDKSGYFSVDTKNPQRGDLLYWKPTGSNTKTDHIGIVTGYNSSTKELSTVEGNKGDEVVERTYNMNNYSSIKGFYRF
jgi:hypothetical protein